MKKKVFPLLVPATVLTIFFLSFTSCRKLVEVNSPVDQLTQDKVFTDASTIQSAVTGLYSYTFTSSFPFYYGTEFYGGMIADELYYRYSYYDNYKNNAYGPKTSSIGYFWSYPYKVIYEANSIIENLQNSTVLPQAAKTQYIGEAKFFRAFGHFLLANLFGDVPLILSTDVSKTALQPRTSKDSVLAQVTADLTDAAAALQSSSNPKTRVTANAATALLARVYLYRKNWANAEANATQVLQSGQFSLETDLNRVFLRTSTESIFQASSDNSNSFYLNSTILGAILVPDGAYVPYYLVRPELLNAFEAGDQRKANWIGVSNISGTNYYYPYKYKLSAPPTNTDAAEDYVILRLAEQYLIRAEARAQQGNIAGAVSDLNTIRQRAGLPAKSTSITQANLLLAIEQERRTELFIEWGHRWFDVTRTGRADAVFGAEKPTWKSTAALLPLPFSELQNNPRLAQNPGY